jgi:hypothetical protein
VLVYKLLQLCFQKISFDAHGEEQIPLLSCKEEIKMSTTNLTKSCRPCKGTGKTETYTREAQVTNVPLASRLGLYYTPQTTYREVYTGVKKCDNCAGVGRI